MNLRQTLVYITYAAIFRKSGSANHATGVKASRPCNRKPWYLDTGVFALEKVLLY